MDLNALAPVVALASIAIVFVSANELSSDHPGDVRVVWYLFSLAAVVAFLVATWARASGAIDDGGNFHGDAGRIISYLLKLSLDVKASMLLGLTIGLVVLAPQVIGYVLSGLTGCASPPVLLDGTLSFVAWTFVKSFAVAGGVVLTVAIYAQLDGWNGWSVDQTYGMLLFSTMLLAIAFASLYIYRGMTLVPEVVRRLCPAKITRLAMTTKRWFTRKESPSSGSNTARGL